MATVEEVRLEVGAWLREQLGHTVESEEDLDHEEITFKVLWTEPLRLLFVPRAISDGRTTAELIAALERERVPETLKTGEHWKGRLRPDGMHWVCAHPDEQGSS